MTQHALYITYIVVEISMVSVFCKQNRNLSVPHLHRFQMWYHHLHPHLHIHHIRNCLEVNETPYTMSTSIYASQPIALRCSGYSTSPTVAYKDCPMRKVPYFQQTRALLLPRTRWASPATAAGARTAPSKAAPAAAPWFMLLAREQRATPPVTCHWRIESRLRKWHPYICSRDNFVQQDPKVLVLPCIFVRHVRWATQRLHQTTRMNTWMWFICYACVMPVSRNKIKLEAETRYNAPREQSLYITQIYSLAHTFTDALLYRRMTITTSLITQWNWTQKQKSQHRHHLHRFPMPH